MALIYSLQLGAPEPARTIVAIGPGGGSQPVMLWLFSTWCGTCAASTVAIAENHDRLRQAGLQIIQLRLHENLGFAGQSTKEFASQYAGSLEAAPGWLWGEASQAVSFTYNPNGYAETYCLIDKDGIVQEVAQAPNVTMEKIMTFAQSNGNVGGS